MIEYYKKILLNAGINATDDDIENIENIIDRANVYGCNVNIHDITNVLFPQQINTTEVAKILSKIIEENKNEYRKTT